MFTRSTPAKLFLPFAVLVLGATSFAQDKPKPEVKATTAAKPQDAKPQDAKPAAKPEAKPEAKEAGASTATAALGIPLAGVTKDNATKIHDALQKLGHAGYHCPKCQAESSKEGTCPKCNVALEKDASPKMVAKTVQVDDKGTVHLALDSGQRVKLSEIESAVKANGASVNRADFPLPAYTHIMVSGAANAESAAKLQKALTDAKVFDAVTVSVDDASKSLVVMPTGPTPAKLGAVSTAIEKAASDAKVTDVVFAAPCVECAKKGVGTAACKMCWDAPHKT